MKNRRQSRELVLQTLYAMEVGKESDHRTLLSTIQETSPFKDEGTLGYAQALIAKAVEAHDEIDELLKNHAANWDIKRMTVIDRNILRMAIAELKYFPDVPFKVVIDEAVEIAKQYGTDDSGKFVNGIIDSIYKTMKKGPE